MLRAGARDKAAKWPMSTLIRLMRYAAFYRPDSEPLDRFIKRKGGINACAGRFARRMGQIKPTGKMAMRRSIPVR
jgi:hypothetical protein